MGWTCDNATFHINVCQLIHKVHQNVRKQALSERVVISGPLHTNLLKLHNLTAASSCH
jgi:hypothetical protein